MNLHGYLAREDRLRQPGGLDFTNLYFYTVTGTPCAPLWQWRASVACVCRV